MAASAVEATVLVIKSFLRFLRTFSSTNAFLLVPIHMPYRRLTMVMRAIPWGILAKTLRFIKNRFIWTVQSWWVVTQPPWKSWFNRLPTKHFFHRSATRALTIDTTWKTTIECARWVLHHHVQSQLWKFWPQCKSGTATLRWCAASKTIIVVCAWRSNVKMSKGEVYSSPRLDHFSWVREMTLVYQSLRFKVKYDWFLLARIVVKQRMIVISSGGMMNYREGRNMVQKPSFFTLPSSLLAEYTS